MRLKLLLLVCACASAQTYDVIISGGRVVDGAGDPWFYGDVGIRGDRIARIAPRGMLAGAPARQKIDARGMVVSPGFIDIQGQSRVQLLTGDGRLISHLTQGITTEIMGEGGTDAPANDKTLANESEEARKLDSRFTGPHGFRDWLEAMQQHGSSLNFGSFAGAATLRMYGKGMAQGAPTEAELEEMRGALKRAMEDGAFGMASALIYPPGEYATTRELIELAKVMAPYGGVYITHMRSESDHLLEAIEEAIEIGRDGGVPVEIYHLKASGEANWPKMKQAIARIDEARRAGIDISADMYPYVAGGTGLTACLPPWSAADGKLFENLKDPATRQKIHDEAMAAPRDWENICRESTPAGVMILRLVSPEYRQYQGKRLSEIAAALHKDWAETAIDLISAEHSRIETMFFIGSEENVKLQLQQPWIKIGSDSAGIDPANTRSLAHPRAYGNFPRILGKYVREEHVLTLEDAVRKMTSATANRLSIQDRGLLKEGFYADVVVFDPATIADRATYENPHQISTGIKEVFVNGVSVLHNGVVTGAKPGRIVWGPGHQK
ncbi:MAG TPA: D-aminoacylase [Bryobacteraceae bacterium]|jgi:N-acyl-D-amino-acid deacylase|nr:D-aminoacylase [Bryobacteraceae bacterium]